MKTLHFERSNFKGSRDCAGRSHSRNLAPDIATAQRQQVEAAGLNQIRFAWAGALQPQQAHYYRLQGPSVLVEYDNTQNTTLLVEFNLLHSTLEGNC
ncbi:DUF3500 domain-containing protein [Oscillatoria sp. CS-180]|uniref:DUF3500 domain-containing protein n=1 Tax=Oscillatoria sp. CS-180 TaxID=3021720 RepID=UPI003FA6912B